MILDYTEGHTGIVEGRQNFGKTKNRPRRSFYVFTSEKYGSVQNFELAKKFPNYQRWEIEPRM